MFDTLKLDHMEIWNILLEKFVIIDSQENITFKGVGGGWWKHVRK